MKTDEIKQKYIAARTHHYKLSNREQYLFDVMKEFELAGFEPSELTHSGKIRLRNKYDRATYLTSDIEFKKPVLEHVLKLFPDAYEIRFLSNSVYIR